MSDHLWLPQLAFKQTGRAGQAVDVQTGLRTVEKLFLSHSKSREAWDYSSLLFIHFIIHCNEISLNIDQLFQVVPHLFNTASCWNCSSWLVVSWFQWRVSQCAISSEFQPDELSSVQNKQPPPPAAALYRVRARGLHSRMNSVQSQPSYANHKLNEKHPVCFVELEEREMSKGCIKDFIYV